MAIHTIYKENKKGDDTIKIKKMVKNFRILIRLYKTVSGVDRLWVEFFHGAHSDPEKEISETYNRIVTIVRQRRD